MNFSELWKNKYQILEGIKNNTFKTESIELIFDERMKICNTCPKKDDDSKSCLVPGTQPCCSACGCSLAFKLRSLSSSCPDGKWQSIVNELDEDEINNHLNSQK